MYRARQERIFSRMWSCRACMDMVMDTNMDDDTDRDIDTDTNTGTNIFESKFLISDIRLLRYQVRPILE